MKRVAATVGILLLVALLAAPVFGYRGGPSGGWSRGSGYCGQGGGWYGSQPLNRSDQLERLEEKFYNNTANLRDRIWSKSEELDNLMNSPNSDPKKITALQKEISELRAKLDEEKVNFELEARKIAPKSGYSRGYSRGYGRHMGPQSGSYGGYGHGMYWR